VVAGHCPKCYEIYRSAELVADRQDRDIVRHPHVFGDQPTAGRIERDNLPGPMRRSRSYGGALLVLARHNEGSSGGSQERGGS
jgi:hypothetical protein